MAPVNLKLNVMVDAKELNALPDVVKKANAKVEGENKASAAKVLADVDRAERERIALQNKYSALEMSYRKRTGQQQEAEEERRAARRISLQRASIALQEKMEAQKAAEAARVSTAIEAQRIARQRASIALEERMERERAAIQTRASVNALRETKSQADATLRIERQAAIANASLVLDKFDRRIAIEKIKHTQILADLKGNNAAIEAETRRHEAVVGRIRMDQGSFANTPFQKMLENFNKLNMGLGKMTPLVTTAAGQIGQMSGTLGMVSGAASAFGGALSSLVMGPIGWTIAGVTALSAGFNLIIQNAERAADLRASFGKTVEDPAKIQAMIAAMDRFDAAKGKRGAGQVNASKELQALSGSDADQLKGMGLDGIGLRRLAEAQKKIIEYKRIHNADALRLDKELADSRIALMEGETNRAMAQENARHSAEVKAVAGHKENLAKAEALHNSNVQKIRNDAARRAADEAEKIGIEERDRSVGMFKSRMAAEYAIGKAAREDQEAAQREDEKRTEEIYKARAQLGQAQAGEDPLKQMSARHAAELAEIVGNETAITDTKARHLLERENLEKESAERSKVAEAQVFAAKLGYYGAYANSVGQIIGVMGVKSKAAFAIQKGVALGEIAIRTAAAVVEDNSRLVTAWKVPYDIALGASQAAIVAATALKGFRTGGYTGSGPADEVAGIVHRDEYVVPRDDLARVGGPSAMRGMLNGTSRGGGVTHTGNVNINVTLPAGATPAQAQEMGRSAAIGYQEEMRRHAKLTADVAYYGVTA